METEQGDLFFVQFTKVWCKIEKLSTNEHFSQEKDGGYFGCNDRWMGESDRHGDRPDALAWPAARAYSRRTRRVHALLPVEHTADRRLHQRTR